MMALKIGDLETQTLAEQIETALKGAGWTETSWKGQVVQITRTDKPSMGLISSIGVIIRVHASHELSFREAIATFAVDLNAIGIEAGTLQWDNLDPNEDAVQVLIGKKPIPLLPSSP